MGKSSLLFICFVSVMLSCLVINCSLVVTCMERANLLALLYVMFSCFVTSPFGVLGLAWYLIALIPDIAFFLTLIRFGDLSLIFNFQAERIVSKGLLHGMGN